MNTLRDSEKIKTQMIWEINTQADVVGIAYNVLQGEIARVTGQEDRAVQFFQAAVEAGNPLVYNEPPEWFFSVRHLLGDRSISEDLNVFPENGFALKGLYHSLEGLNKVKEASQVLKQFHEAWKNADLELKYLRVDQSKRKNLAINPKSDSPDNLIYIAGTSCLSNSFCIQ